jgi:SAM-dependent methyltransferase
MTQVAQTSAAPDYTAIKQKQQATWASGNYATIGTTLQIVGETLCEALDLRAGETVLDVAAGNGNVSLAAARRFAQVTSSDYVPKLLSLAQMRTAAEGLTITFTEADAEALPFGDGAFDVAVSTFGIMFAPDQSKAARELMRVVRTSGRIGLANWTPEGFIGQLFKVVGRHVPPPAGLMPPSLWGTETRLKELFPGKQVSASKRLFNFRYASAGHWVEVFRAYYGPVHRAFAALDDKGKVAFETDLLALLTSLDRGGGKGLVVPGEYLEAIIVN